MSFRAVPVCAALLCAVAIVGCGGDSGDEADTTVETATQGATTVELEFLTRAQIRVMDRAKAEVAAYCRQVGRALGGGPPPDPSTLERAGEAIQRLGALAAQHPESTSSGGITPRVALGDIAEDLEGTNCAQGLVDEIDEALGSLPPE